MVQEKIKYYKVTNIFYFLFLISYKFSSLPKYIRMYTSSSLFLLNEKDIINNAKYLFHKIKIEIQYNIYIEHYWSYILIKPL